MKVGKETPFTFRAGELGFNIGMIANEVLNRSKATLVFEALTPTAPARAKAEAFLRQLLADGPIPARRIEAAAKDAGLAMRTIRRAKNWLGVKASKTGLDGPWVWSLVESG